MPLTEIKYFQDDSGRAPAKEWLEDLKRKKQLKGLAKYAASLEKLHYGGHTLSTPTAKILRGGIYELRAHDGNVQYRILYFFDQSQRNTAVIVLGFIKQSIKQQDVEIDRACRCKVDFDQNPAVHTYSDTTP